MIGYLKRLTIRNIVSPYGLAIVSYLVFLFAWLFPPGLYTEYINEPDLMFLEPWTLIFYTMCAAAFLFGVRACRFFGAPVPGSNDGRVSLRSPLSYLVPPLLAAALFAAIYLIKMGGKLNFLGLLASQQGNAIKAAGAAGQMSEGRWDEAVPLLTVVLWWSLSRAIQLKLRGSAKIIFYLLFLLSAGLGVAISVATVSRDNLMPIILGTLVIYIFARTRTANTRVIKLALTALVGAAGAVGSFLFISFLRGVVGLNLLITGLLGYTIVSYNRMAALLMGTMHYACEGRGVYLCSFLLMEGKINDVFHFIDRFGFPTPLALWQTEFSSTAAAGLKPGFNWSGAFGYVYSDIGWWSPFYWFVIGMIAGWLWEKFSSCKTVGLVLYPWVAFSVLMWCGGNIIFLSGASDIDDKVVAGPAVGFLGPGMRGLDRGFF
jgi:hypothetical protein